MACVHNLSRKEGQKELHLNSPDRPVAMGSGVVKPSDQADVHDTS